MEKANEIIKKYLEGEKAENLIKELKNNNLHFAAEENLDIRYSKLKSDMDEKTKQYAESQKHIEELNQGLKNGEDLKTKQAEYEQKIQELELENQNIRIQSALKQALTQAKATDLDYLTYKITNKFKAENKPFELDETGNIKGLSEVIELEKKANNKFFESEIVAKEVDVKNVGKGDSNAESEPKNLTEALAEKYKINTT